MTTMTCALSFTVGLALALTILILLALITVEPPNPYFTQ